MLLKLKIFLSQQVRKEKQKITLINKEHTMMKFHQLTTQFVAGIDLHKSNLTICIMNKQGEILCQQVFKRKKSSKLKKILSPYGNDITVGVETTYNWYWLYDWCLENEFPVVVGHALYIKQKIIGKNKTDKIDAKEIANLLRINDFPLSFSCPLKHRTMRDLIRRRIKFTQMHTSIVNHISCLHDQYNLEEFQEKVLNGPDKNYYDPFWLSMDTDTEIAKLLKQKIKLIEKEIEIRATKDFEKEYKLLRSIRGIGPVIAGTLVYEIQDLERFPTVQQFSSYCRVVNPACESGGKRVGRGNTKMGNPYLCYVLHELVESSRKYNPEIQKKFQKLKKRRGIHHAHRILAHEWAITIYQILKNDSNFSLEQFCGMRHVDEPSQSTGLPAAA